MKKYRTIGIIGTILIHLLMILYFIPWKRIMADPATTPPLPEIYVEIRLIPNPSTANEDLPISNNGWKSYKIDSEICKDVNGETYVGIGIIYNPATYRIISAPSQYPAYLAGLREGDILVNPFNNTIADENGIVHVDIFRGEERLTFSIKQDKICFVSNKPKVDR